jgi:hypothetical protein
MRSAGLPPGRTPTRLRHDKLLPLAPSDGRPSERRLGAMVASCASRQQLTWLVKTHGEAMTATHVTAALSALERRLSADGGRGGGGSFGDRGGSGGSSAEGGAWQSGGRGGGGQPAQRALAPLADRLSRLLLRRADGADGRAVGVALWTLGRVAPGACSRGSASGTTTSGGGNADGAGGGSRSSISGTASELLLLAALRAEQLDGQALAMVLNAAVALKLRPPPGVSARLLARLRAAAPTLAPQALANCLWALARLQLGTAGGSGSGANRSGSSSSGGGDREGGSSGATVGTGSGGATTGAAADRRGSGALPEGLLEALEARARQQIASLGPQHMSMAMWGLARLRVRPGERFLQVGGLAAGEGGARAVVLRR